MSWTMMAAAPMKGTPENEAAIWRALNEELMAFLMMWAVG
jgi:hypothetical protein